MTPPPLPLSPLLMTKCMVVLLTKGLEGSRGRDRALIYVFLVGRCLGKTQWRPSAQSLPLRASVMEPWGLCTLPLNHYTALHLDDSQISRKKKSVVSSLKSLII